MPPRLPACREYVCSPAKGLLRVGEPEQNVVPGVRVGGNSPHESGSLTKILRTRIGDLPNVAADMWMPGMMISVSKKPRVPRPPERLVQHLADQLEFLRRSAAGYDDGFEGEACRMAVVLRTLLHNTQQSHGLLVQLAILKPTTLVVDTAMPIEPGNLLPTPGLVMMRVGEGVGGAYVPRLDESPLPPRMVAFESWWTGAVCKFGDGATQSRKDYVLVLANREGGAHVDPMLNETYERVVTSNGLGFQYGAADGILEDFRGNPVAASVRQIAFEFLATAKRLKLADGRRVSGLNVNGAFESEG